MLLAGGARPAAMDAEQRPVFYGDTRVVSDRRKGTCLFWVRAPSSRAACKRYAPQESVLVLCRLCPMSPLASTTLHFTMTSFTNVGKKCKCWLTSAANGWRRRSVRSRELNRSRARD